MTDITLRAALPYSQDLQLFAKSEESVVYWEGELARRFGLYGPVSGSYRSAERNLIGAHVNAGNWQEALQLAQGWEKRHAGEMTIERAENFYVLATCYLALGKVIECKELVGAIIAVTKEPVFGQWTMYYHVLFLTILADMIETHGRRNAEKIEAAAIRYAAFIAAKQHFGPEVTLTVQMRLLLALSQERNGDREHALANYQKVYAYLKKRDLFPTLAARIGLLARTYRMQKQLGLEQEARESRMWIKNLLAKDPSLTESTKRYLGES